jgi:hypothetical protein
MQNSRTGAIPACEHLPSQRGARRPAEQAAIELARRTAPTEPDIILLVERGWLG